MLTEEVEVTFIHLLELAIANPDSGAVNFAYLNEFLRGIIKHLGIADKHASLTQEIDYQGEGTPLVPRTVSVPEGFAPDTSGDGTDENNATDLRASPQAPVGGRRRASSLTNKRLVNNRGSITESTDNLKEGSDMLHVLNINRRIETAEAAIEGLTSLFDRMKQDIEELKVGQDSNAEEDKNPNVTQPSMSQPSVSLPSEPTTITASEDLNEALESARKQMFVQIASAKKDMSSELAAMKDQLSAQFGSANDKFLTEIKSIKDEVSKAMESEKEKTSAMISDFRKDLNSKLDSCTSKDDVKDLCSVAKVNELINKNMLAFTQSTQPTSSVMEGAESGSDVPAAALNALQNELRISTKLLSDRTEMIENSLENKIVAQQEELKENVSKLRLEVQENKEKIIENNEKITSVDSETKQIVTKVEDLGKNITDSTSNLANKLANIATAPTTAASTGAAPTAGAVTAGASATSAPASKTVSSPASNPPDMTAILEPIENEISSLNEKISSVTNNVVSMNGIFSGINEKLRQTQKTVTGLTAKNESFATAQRGALSSVTKLAREVEENTENIHRLQQAGGGPRVSNADQDTEGSLTKIRGAIYDLQEKQVVIQNQVDTVASNNRRNEKQTKELSRKMTQFDETKVDMEHFNTMLDLKADKKLFNQALSQEQFDECVTSLDRGIESLKQDIFGNDTRNRKVIQTLQDVVEGKLDREEANQIRNYIDSRFKSFKPKMPAMKPAEDCAAGSRKQVVPNCNCISCDRPVDVAMNGRCPTLPYFHALPGMKSIRPVTTFELQTIRQHMHHNWTHGNAKDARFSISDDREKLQRELLQLCGVSDLEELSGGVLSTETSNRPCGGVHTLANQRKNKPPMFYREDMSAFGPTERQETNVVGKDGHVYKGRLQQQTAGTPELPEIVSGDGGRNKSPASENGKADIVTVLPTIES